MRFARSPFGLITASFLFASAPLLTACDPVSLTIGAGAATGVAAVQERGIKGVARDTAIEARILKLWIELDKKLATSIGVEVYESRALLTGYAQTEKARADAVKLAWKADGVKDVINEILIGPSGGVSEFARDSSITGQLKSKLTLDGEVLAVNYAIETVRGAVYLIGIAQSQEELDRVIRQARNISYVKRVISHVRVKAQGEGES